MNELRTLRVREVDGWRIEQFDEVLEVWFTCLAYRYETEGAALMVAQKMVRKFGRYKLEIAG